MNDHYKKNTPEIHDVWVAFSLLTRVPIPVDHLRAANRGARAAWAYPLVGLILGAIAGSIGAILEWIGVPAGIAAATALAFLAIASGAMHEDGLADFADGIGGGTTKERRMEIMHDSRIGAFGALAIILAVLSRWSAIEYFSGWTLVSSLAVAGATSRAAMVLAMIALPNASTSGLSASSGRPDARIAGLAILVAGIAAFFLTGLGGIIVVFVAIAGILPVLWLANTALGGQTGDVLGAAQQISEIAVLAALIALQ